METIVIPKFRAKYLFVTFVGNAKKKKKNQLPVLPPAGAGFKQNIRTPDV